MHGKGYSGKSFAYRDMLAKLAALNKRKARLQTELAQLPAHIATVEREIEELESRLKAVRF